MITHILRVFDLPVFYSKWIVQFVERDVSSSPYVVVFKRRGVIFVICNDEVVIEAKIY